MFEKKHIFNEDLIKKSPTIARMDEVYLEELTKAIISVGGNENLSYDDLEEVSRLATERLAEEQQQGLIE